MIISSQQHDVQAIMKSQFEVRMMLTIRNLQKTDVGNYKCVAKNSLGDVESSIRLYGEYEFIIMNLSLINFINNNL